MPQETLWLHVAVWWKCTKSNSQQKYRNTKLQDPRSLTRIIKVTSLIGVKCLLLNHSRQISNSFCIELGLINVCMGLSAWWGHSQNPTWELTLTVHGEPCTWAQYFQGKTWETNVVWEHCTLCGKGRKEVLQVERAEYISNININWDKLQKLIMHSRYESLPTCTSRKSILKQITQFTVLG